LAGLRGTDPHNGDHAGLYRPEGCGLVEIMHACGSPAKQALEVPFGRNGAGLIGGSLGEIQRACGARPWQGRRVGQKIGNPSLWISGSTGLLGSTNCSFSKLWCGESFHELGIQSADISAVPCASLQPRVSPASQQSSWFTELTWSM
jgi:hypothetical protein